MKKFFTSDKPFILECGDSLPSLTIAYHTFGSLNEKKDNVVWVMHGLTANSDIEDWWPGTVGEGLFLDPTKYFIICANVLGSCYGTTGPLTAPSPESSPLYGNFPKVTIRDMVNAHKLLAAHLGINRIHELIGVSLGGFQAIEWAVGEPGIAENVMFCATDASCSPWLAAFNKSMYMAIETDPSWGDPRSNAAQKGLATARSIALISYRGPFAYNMSQKNTDDSADPFHQRVHSYQEYQGKKLCSRFDAYSYVTICRSADSHNVGRGRGGIDNALARIKANALVIGITSDILFPAQTQMELAKKIPGATFEMMDSNFGHDGFLIEHEQLNAIMKRWRLSRKSSIKNDGDLMAMKE